MKRLLLLLIGILMVLGFALLEVLKRTPVPNYSTDPIENLSFQPGDLVKSPLTITGEAPGAWYFEATFPVVLKDRAGREIASAPAHAEGDWMMLGPVPFSVTLIFNTPGIPTGTLVFKKDNPSGLPKNDASVLVPVRFR